MGTTTSFNFEREREAEKKKKENNEFRSEKLRCDFCGRIAIQIIKSTGGRTIPSCFHCVPNYKKLPWIRSAEKII